MGALSLFTESRGRIMGFVFSLSNEPSLCQGKPNKYWLSEPMPRFSAQRKLSFGDQHEFGVLQMLDHDPEETARFNTVDHPMIESER
jgi:hypothetical protein